MSGFSPRNLKYMRAFAEAHPEDQIVLRCAAQIPWRHNQALPLPAIVYLEMPTFDRLPILPLQIGFEQDKLDGLPLVLLKAKRLKR